MIVPLVPLKIAPPSAGILAPSSSSGGRGASSPSYQVSLTGGRLPRAGNWNVTTAASGWTSFVEPQQVASTLVGAASFERGDDRIERVHAAVAHHAAAEVPPASPGARVIGPVIGPHGRRADPEIPVEPGGNRRRLLGTLGPLRAPVRVAPGVIGQAAPRVDLADLADQARPDPLAESAGCLRPSGPGCPSGSTTFDSRAALASIRAS